MDTNPDAILPKPEALHALSKAAAEVFRRVCDPDFVIETDLSEDRASLIVTAWFPQGQPGDQAHVRVALGPEGWTPFVDYRLRHEFIHVVRKRLDLERFISDYVSAKIREVINAFA